MRRLLGALLAVCVLLGQAVAPAVAANDERALYLYYTHTGETARVVFKRNGQYVQSGLQQMNHMLRDWRKNQPTNMDPHLFDLVWEVYREVGATQPINIVSGFRSPTTNEMLRSRPGSGVAENSQHTKGHAMDFFIPGIPLTKLRAVAMRQQVGGVGYYPTSGSPFVHLDTGSVRAWPRMTRAQLAAVFPDGKTLHLPVDGKPLSGPGRAYAMAQWSQCHTVPCNGPIATGSTRFASTGSSGKSLVDLLFTKTKGAQAPSTIQVALVPEPALAPTPLSRPARFGAVQTAAADILPPVLPFSTQGSAPLPEGIVANLKDAPTPAMKSQALLVATAATLPASQGQETALTALAAIGAPLPASRVLMSNRSNQMVTAYAPAAPEPGAEQALQILIARNSDTRPQTAILPPLPGEQPKPRVLAGASGIRTASLGGASDLTPLVGLFDLTWGAVEQRGNSQPVADALAARVVNATMRDGDLVAPDLDHVAEVFLTPVVMTSDHYAVIYDHDEADFSPMTELGPYVTHMRVGDVPPDFSFDRFVMSKPLALMAR